MQYIYKCLFNWTFQNTQIMDCKIQIPLICKNLKKEKHLKIISLKKTEFVRINIINSTAFNISFGGDNLKNYFK